MGPGGGGGGMGGLFCSSVASGEVLRTESGPRFRLTAGETGMDQPWRTSKS